MFLGLALTLLTSFITAASIHQVNENVEGSLEKKDVPESDVPVSDLLTKLSSSLGKAIAKKDGLSPENLLNDFFTNDFRNILNVDSKKNFPEGKIPNFESLKTILGDEKVFESMKNVFGANFDEKVINDIMNGNLGDEKFDEKTAKAHNEIDKNLSELFGVDMENIVEYRKKAMASLAKNVNDLKVDDLFGEYAKKIKFDL